MQSIEWQAKVGEERGRETNIINYFSLMPCGTKLEIPALFNYISLPIANPNIARCHHDIVILGFDMGK